MQAITHERNVTSAASSRRHALPGWLDSGEPHLARGPFTRWPRAADAALAVVVFATSVVAVAVSALGEGERFTIDSIGDQPVGSLALLAAAAAALAWRRQRPIAVTAFITVLMIGWAIVGYGDGQDLALVAAVYAVGRYTDDHRRSLVVVTTVTVVSLLDTIIDTNQRIDIAPAIMLGWLPWYLGLRIRNRGDYLALLQERAQRLEAEQHAEADRAVADERSRIARELHDIVAHQVSMMTVQAGAAKTVARSDLDAAIDAMGDVEHAGRQALGELRRLLGVLRPDGPGGDDLGPQPGLRDIPALTDKLIHTGADVSLTISQVPAGLPAAVELSAYRIVQEAYTNIIKHAGPNPTVEVTISIDDQAIAIDITNSATRSLAQLPTSGYGIAGMRERAALLGGTLTTARHDPDRYCVSGRLPLVPEPT